MYLYDTKTQLYYKVTDKSKFLADLEDKDFEDIKQIFKMTYQENLLQNSLRVLRDKGFIIIEGEPVDMSDSVEMFREYIYYRFSKAVYDKMISNFEADFDYRMKVIANPSLLN